MGDIYLGIGLLLSAIFLFTEKSSSNGTRYDNYGAAFLIVMAWPIIVGMMLIYYIYILLVDNDGN